MRTLQEALTHILQVLVAVVIVLILAFFVITFVMSIPELLALTIIGGLLTLVAALFTSVGLSLSRCHRAWRLGYWRGLGAGYKVWAAVGPLLVLGLGFYLPTRTDDPIAIVGYWVLACILGILGWFGLFLSVGPEEVIGSGGVELPPHFLNTKNWDSDATGSFSVSGPMADWMQTFRAWHAEDARGTATPFGTYWPTMVLICGSFALGKWQREPDGKDKTEKLQSYITRASDGSVSVAFMDYFEFLAEHLSETQLKEWGTHLRAEMRKRLKRS